MSTTFPKESLIDAISAFVATQLEGFCREEHADASFSRLGLDSAAHVQLSTIIEDHLQIEAEPTLAFDYPTINSIVNYLEKEFLLTRSEGGV